MNITETIKKACVDSNLTIAQLEEKIGMSKNNLFKIFKRGSIETKHLEKISSVLGVPMSYFFEDNSIDKSVNQKGNDNYAITGGSNNFLNEPDENKYKHLGNNRIKYLENEVERLNKELLSCKNEIIDILKSK